MPFCGFFLRFFSIFRLRLSKLNKDTPHILQVYLFTSAGTQSIQNEKKNFRNYVFQHTLQFTRQIHEKSAEKWRTRHTNYEEQQNIRRSTLVEPVLLCVFLIRNETNEKYARNFIIRHKIDSSD